MKAKKQSRRIYQVAIGSWRVGSPLLFKQAHNKRRRIEHWFKHVKVIKVEG